MRYFNLHTHQALFDPRIIAVVNQYPQNLELKADYFSVGIHPWYIDEKTVERELQIIESQMQSERCIAVGECGLDNKSTVPFDKQMEVFDAQISIAMRYKKPIIVHCVGAYSEVLAVGKRIGSAVPMVIHGFSKNISTAQQLLNQGFYLSFGKSLFQNPDMEQVFQKVPDARIFLETDTMDIGIAEVYARAAECKNTTISEVQKLIATNVKSVFNLCL